MKIAVFSDTTDPQKNGVAQSIERQRAALTSLGHEVVVVSSEEFSPDIPVKDITVLSSKDSNYKLRIPIRQISKYLNFRDIDFIHIHTPFSYGIAGLMLSKRYSIPTIYTHHTDFNFYLNYMWTLNNSVGRSICRTAYKSFLLQVDGIVCPSKSSRESLVRDTRISTDKIFILPTPLEVQHCISFEKRETCEYDILCVGRLSSEKNIFITCEVICRLEHKFPGIRVLFIGTGKDEMRIRKIVKQNMLMGVQFLGELPHSEVLSFMRKSRIVFSASVSETQGLVIQEAWASGAPVVCAASPSVMEFVRHGRDGWIAAPTIDDLSELLILVLDQKLDLQRKVFESCLSRLTEFSYGRWGCEYMKMAQKVLKWQPGLT